MKHILAFLGSRRWNLALDAVLLAGVCGYLFCLLFPGGAGDITSSQLEGGQYYSYVVAPNGDLIGWGADDMLSHKPGMLEYPYIARKTVLKDVKTVSVGDRATMAVDENGDLWGWGDEERLFTDKRASFYSPVYIMGDVEQAVVPDGCAAVIKADRSLWVWGGGLEPRKLMDRAERCFACAGMLFARDLDGQIYYWNGLSDMLKVKRDASLPVSGLEIKEMSYAYSFCTQCLTEDGALYLLTWNWHQDPVEAVLTGPVRQDVASLCDSGFVTKSGELICWGWTGNEDDSVSTVKIAENVQCAENEFLYVTRDGRVHAESAISPVTLRTVSPVFRNLFLLWAAVKAVSLKARKKQAA